MAKQHRGDIQGLRAVAVLLVLLDHADIPGGSGGYVGVDVFFVISGFLITGVLLRQAAQSGRVSIADFYARRARRILPAATVVLVAITSVSALTLTAARQHQVGTHVLWAALFGANVYSARSGSDYFAADDFVSPVQHFWSLAVEEQFYLVWPALLALIFAARRRRPGRRMGPLSPGARPLLPVAPLMTAIGLLCALSFAWSVWQSGSAPTKAYYSTLTRGWELGAGALVSLATGWIRRWTIRTKLVASWAGLAAIAAAALGYSAATSFPGYAAALPVAGAALLLAGGTEGPAYGARLVLDTRPMRWFGDISYSLYLWHWPFLVLPELYGARKLTPAERSAALAGAILTAWLSYRYIETPVRRSPVLFGRRGRSLILWPTATAVVVGAVLVSGSGATTAPTAPATLLDGLPGPVRSNVDQAAYAVGVAAARAKAHHRLPEQLHPALSQLDSDVSRLPSGCGVERDDATVSTCVLGDPAGRRTLVLFGDSHVIMWLQPMERLAKAHGWRIIPVEKASCFPVDATLWRSDKRRPYTECDAWRAHAYRVIAKIAPDRIITSGLVAPSIADPATGGPARGAVGMGLFADGVRRTLLTLRTYSRQVDVIGGTPNLAASAGDCLGTRQATMATCARPVDAGLTWRNAVWKRAAAVAGARFLNPVPWLCADRVCPIVVGNIVVYRDTNHITRTFAAALQPELARMLKL